jgi:signal peptide peptidase SppA
MNELMDIKFWAGTEESFGVYLLCLKKMIDSGDFEKFAAGAFASQQSQASEEDVPRLFSQHGNVGIVKIAGPLNNSSSWLNQVYGMTGYPEIRDAMVYAAKKPDVGAIVLDVGSGGGAVAGVFDTANLISTIDSQVKPVHTFSSGGIMSAAYLLGSAARTVNIDQMAEAGSIGVVAVHQEMSKMLADIGITPTVIRSGKYKALGNPFEPLNDTAKSEMQSQVDHLAGIFDQHVADQRGTTAQIVNEKMGQGRIFIGQQAKDVGLVDGISSFDAVVSKIQGGIDSAKDRSKYGANSTNKNNQGIQAVKTPLTEKDIVALAAAGFAVKADAELTAEQTQALEAARKAEKEAADKAASDAAAAAASKNDKTPTALELVQGQLAAAQAQVTNLTIELRDEKAASEKVKGSHASMRAIVVASAGRMKVALGQTPGGEDALDDAALLAAHEALVTEFQKKFPAGGVAAVAADKSNKSQDASDPTRAARIAATRPTGKK